MTSTPISEREAPRFTVGVQGLIATNAAIYYLQLVGIFGSLEKTFGFSVRGFEGRWWTIVSFMFVHAGFWHLAANLYALYLFGPRLEQAWGTRRFLRFYLFGAIAGLLTHAALIHDGSTLIGSSAPVFAVMIAHAMLWPTDEVFILGVFPMRVWTAVWSMIGLMTATGIYFAGDAGLHFEYLAHLGGAIGGWAFMRTPGAPSLEQLRQRVSRVPDAEDPPRAIPRSQPRGRERDDVDDVVQRSRATLSQNAPSSRVVAPRAGNPQRDDLNRVLDKISAQGISSLSEAERRMLEDMARHLRDS